MPTQKIYDDLLAELTESPATVEYPVSPDEWEESLLTAEDVTSLAFEAAYSDDSRMIFLRALAASARDDNLKPMMGLVAFVNGDGGFNMLNRAVNCLDLSIPGYDRAAEAQAINEARLTVQPMHRWHYLYPLACLSWPNVDHGQTPADPFTGAGIPTLIVASELDPATPYSQALSLIENLENGHLLTVRGGWHVMFGRGIACIDEAVTAFLQDETPPPPKCEVEAMPEYVALLPERPEHWLPEELLDAVDDELSYFPGLALTDGTEWLTFTCINGGGLNYTATEAHAHFVFDHCGLSDQITVFGSGSWDFIEGVTTFDVSIKGVECSFLYIRWWDDMHRSVEPSCDQDR